MMNKVKLETRRRGFLGLVALVVVGWVLYDLYGPRTAHLREFDADEGGAP